MIAAMLSAVHRASSRAGLLPSFLVIGAQRAGTTTLFDALRRHPDIVRPTPREPVIAGKEVRFFDKNFWRDVDWYRSFFQPSVRQRLGLLRGTELVAGESTPYYLFHPIVPERVAATIPDVRLIALLRNPIERAYSHYQLARRNGREKLSFAEAVAVEEKRLAGTEKKLRDPQARVWHHRAHSYVARGLYADQLERWLAYFPREQLLVLRAEDLFAQPDRILTEVLAFLGLRPLPLAKARHRNRAVYAPLDPEVRALLEERFAEPNRKLARLLGDEFTWPATGSAEKPARTEAAQARR